MKMIKYNKFYKFKESIEEELFSNSPKANHFVFNVVKSNFLSIAGCLVLSTELAYDGMPNLPYFLHIIPYFLFY